MREPLSNTMEPRQGSASSLWRLDSLAGDAVKRKSSKTQGTTGHMTGESGPDGFATLDSTLPCTRGQLTRLMSSQISALPEGVLAADSGLQHDQMSFCGSADIAGARDNVMQQAHQAADQLRQSADDGDWHKPRNSIFAAATAEAAAAAAAAAAGASESHSDSFSSKRRPPLLAQSLSVVDENTERRPEPEPAGPLTRSSSFYRTPFATDDFPDAGLDPAFCAVPHSPRVSRAAAGAGAGFGSVGSAASGRLSPRAQSHVQSGSVFAVSGSLSSRTSSVTGAGGVPVGPSLSRRFSTTSSIRSAGPPLARSSTLKHVESGNAWWELHELEMQQIAHDPALSRSSSCQYSAASGATQPPAAAAKADSPPAVHAADSHPTPASAAAAAGGTGAANAGVGSKQEPQLGFFKGLMFKAVMAVAGTGRNTTSFSSRLASWLNLPQAGGDPVFGKAIRKTAHTTMSPDGWTLHLVHCVDTGLQPEQRKRHPVLMCPGLASSGPGTFDLMPKVSIVDFLASEGYDVWYIDIRGNGLADKNSRIDIETQWNIDDYLVQDVPTCIRYVLEHTQAPMVHWVGHSMGGMLGSGLCSQAGKWGRCLRSVMLLGSGCFGDGSWHCLLKKLVIPITKWGFPAHLGTQGLALLANTPAALSVFETLFYWCRNMEVDTRQALLMSCFNFIPQRLVAQFLETHDSPEGLQGANKSAFLYADPDVLVACKVPCLGINGDWDLFCPAAGGAKNVNLFGGPKKHIPLGPAHGCQHHYGHFDVIMGKNAQQEVWPHIKAWLDQHDSPATEDDLWDPIEWY